MYDYESTPVSGEGELSALRNEVEKMRLLSTEIRDLEERLKTKQRELDHLSMEIIPEMFETVGLSEIRLSDGSKVTITSRFFGKISDENLQAAHDYLENVGSGALVKRQMSIDLGKTERERADEVRDALSAIGVTPAEKESVHPQTLYKFIREQMEAGVADFPQEVFGVFRKTETKIG